MSRQAFCTCEPLAFCSNGGMTPREKLIYALDALCRREGGIGNVALEIDSSEETLRQILKGYKLPSGQPRGLGPQLARRLDARYPGWSDHPIGVQSREGVDTLGSLAQYSTPPRITLEALMERLEELPERFIIAMPDDALAPQLPKGMELIFAKGQKPSPGHGVLVRDGDGRVFVRRYAEAPGGRWLAQATNSAYATLEAERDSLQLVATMTGRLSGLI